MAGNITKITLNASTPTAIKATVYSNRVQVQEDNAATTDFLVFRSVEGGVPSTLSRRVTAGSTYDFFKGTTVAYPFCPNEPIGFLQAVTGAPVFVIDESGA